MKVNGPERWKLNKGGTSGSERSRRGYILTFSRLSRRICIYQLGVLNRGNRFSVSALHHCWKKKKNGKRRKRDDADDADSLLCLVVYVLCS